MNSRRGMTVEQRVYSGIDGGAPYRVPVVPKIWIGLGARLTGTSLLDVIRDPLATI